MAATLQELEAWRDALIAQRGNHVARYRIQAGGDMREFVYKTDAEIAAAIKDLECRIAAMNGARNRIILTSTSKGV